MISAMEIQPGVVKVTIKTADYGDAGKHWRDVLSGPKHGGYGKIYIQRHGANRRRYQNCYGLRDYYRGNPAANLDECPGAMFIWTSAKEADVEALDAVANQALGRDLGLALRKFAQRSSRDLWEVVFHFA